MSHPYIVAEIGSNWRTLDDCLLSIRAAKAAGADAVKFQLFNPIALYGDIPSIMSMPIKVQGEGPYLPHDWLPLLKAESDRAGIDFMCTAFSPELAEIVNPLVKTHKIASAELSHVRLLQKINTFGKPVYLSTGASGPDEISWALKYLKDVPVTLLYCVAAYPAKLIDLNVMGEMKKRFHLPVGFSDHSISAIEIPRRAAELGATVIEKHMQAVEGEFPDTPHSLTQQEFTWMVQAIKEDYAPRMGWTSEEQPMVLRHKRRLIALQAIEPGDMLEEGKNFGVYRSLQDETQALSGFALFQVTGKRAKVRIEAGQGIGPNQVE